MLSTRLREQGLRTEGLGVRVECRPSVVVAGTNAGYDSQLGGPVLGARDALCLAHQQRAIPLCAGHGVGRRVWDLGFGVLGSRFKVKDLRLKFLRFKV